MERVFVPGIKTREEQERENAAIRAKYPVSVARFEVVVCCWCINRGERTGCKFGLLPVTIEGKGCPKLEGWGRFTREGIARDANAMLKLPVGKNFGKSLCALCDKPRLDQGKGGCCCCCC